MQLKRRGLTSKESAREVQCDRDELLMNMDTQSLHMVPLSCMDEINLCLGLIVNEGGKKS
jgi:hypothetical protein